MRVCVITRSERWYKNNKKQLSPSVTEMVSAVLAGNKIMNNLKLPLYITSVVYFDYKSDLDYIYKRLYPLYQSHINANNVMKA